MYSRLMIWVGCFVACTKRAGIFKMWQKLKLKQVIPTLVVLCLCWTTLKGIQALDLIYPDRKMEFWLALCFIILLMPVNILLEAAKLKAINQRANGIYDSIVKTCQGFSMQFLWPFGLGAVIGRIWNVEHCQKRPQIEATLLGGMMQSFCNLSGLIFLLFIPGSVLQKFNDCLPDWNRFWLISILGVLGISLLALHIFSNWAGWELWKFAVPLKFMSEGKASWNPGKLSLLFMYSFFRYLIYLMQWIVVLILIGQLPWVHALTAAVVYLALMSLLVLPAPLAFLSRSGVAWSVFGSLGMDPVLSVGLCWLIFLLNNGIPAMFGSCFLFKSKVWLAKRS